MSYLTKTGLFLTNVQRFGARPGGSASANTTAIQAAVNSAIANNAGGIFFPPGIYDITAPGISIAGATNFRITGCGWGSRIRFVAEDHASAVRRMLNFHSSCSLVIVDDLLLDGNRANIVNGNLSTDLISIIGGCFEMDFSRCVVQNSPGNGVSVGDNQATPAPGTLTFRKLNVLNNANRAFNLDDTISTKVHDCEISTNLVGAVFAWMDSNVGFISFINNHMRSLVSSTAGIIIRASADCEISRCKFDGTLTRAIDAETTGLDGILKLVIDNNRIRSISTNSVRVHANQRDIGALVIRNNELNSNISLTAGGGPGVWTDTTYISKNWGTAPTLTANLAIFPEPAIVTGGAFYGATGAAGGVTERMGDAAPEGVITGSPGDAYTKRNGGEFTTRYVKESGANTNTGWRVPSRSPQMLIFNSSPLTQFISSPTYASLGVSASHLFDGNRIMVHLHISCQGNSPGTVVEFGVGIDGGAPIFIAKKYFAIVNDHDVISGVEVIQPTAGLHTISLYWRRSAGTGSLTIDNNDFLELFTMK